MFKPFNSKKQSVSSIGPEGLSVPIETGQNQQNVEVPSFESGQQQEQMGAERKREINLERNIKDNNQVFIPPAKAGPSKQALPQQKIYGYKINPKLLSNFKAIRSKAGKADPQTGIGCLYIFMDRMLRMHQSS